ncbi:hypothetical protein [Paenibacillus spongiae]|uniref:Uncharacterized protein n=1 Tax=Paenibacillus spongiae TaxID=2909671 RepID=A0ABY5S7D5_9BACL|nr:hypothetical protein [Paenibacillus spongiae]UVI29495.1 hypothetical protein L1F29_29430 [Paenibacillus spongiae]
MEKMEQASSISNLGILDLTGKKPEDLEGITLIESVGILIAPASLSGTLMKITQRNIGMTISLPETAGKIKMFNGQLTLSGDVFANHTGAPEDILVLVGQVVITSPIPKVGFSEVVVAGQMIAPKSDEAMIASAVTQLSGQIVYYSSGSPRIFIGDETFSKGFFDLIDDKMAMVLIGDHEIADDVDAATLKQKVSEIVLIGELSVPKALVPVTQFLAVALLGSIEARDEQDA